MTQKEVNKKVGDAFSNTFNKLGTDYSLFRITDTGYATQYAIADNGGIIVEFKVSHDRTRVFDAKSTGSLLTNEYRLQKWMNFMELVNE